MIAGGLILFSADRGLHYWLNKQLPVLLNQNPERKFNISFDHAELNFMDKILVLEGITINPSQIDTTIKSKSTVKQFNIEHANLKRLFFNKEIETGKLIVFEPQITIYAVNDSTDQSKKEINELWIDIFTRLSIANFEISDASLKIMVNNCDDPVFSFESMDLKVDDFEVDTSTIKDPFPIVFSKIWAECQNVLVKFDTISNLKIGLIQLTDTEVSVRRVNLTPVLSPEEFIKVKRAKNNRLEIYFDKVKLNDFTWDLKNDEAKFYASSLYLDSTRLHVFTDHNFPKENKGYKPLLGEMLRKLPFTFSLDSFVVTNSTVLFETKPANQNLTSLIFFDKLYTSGYNLHNTSDSENRTEFDIITNFLGETRIEASYRMNVNDLNDRFQISGNMDDLSTATLNKILQPLVGVETVGEIYGIDFFIYGNNHHSTGTLNFEYNGLKVKVLNSGTYKKNIFLSVLSNMALRKNNIITNKRFRQGNIELSRNTNKGMLSFIWESIKDGLMDTLVPFEIENKGKQQERKRTIKKLDKKEK